MFSSVNFRGVLDTLQGQVYDHSGLDPEEDDPLLLPEQQQYPQVHSSSRDFRRALNAYEEQVKKAKFKQTGKFEWTRADSLEARMKRARQIIAMVQQEDLLTLLQSDDAIRLLAEKRSYLRIWGERECASSD